MNRLLKIQIKNVEGKALNFSSKLILAQVQLGMEKEKTRKLMMKLHLDGEEEESSTSMNDLEEAASSEAAPPEAPPRCTESPSMQDVLYVEPDPEAEAGMNARIIQAQEECRGDPTMLTTAPMLNTGQLWEQANLQEHSVWNDNAGVTSTEDYAPGYEEQVRQQLAEDEEADNERRLR